MDGLGKRLKQRAAALGLSDTKVAERVGLSQTRYAAYAVDKHEPDLAMFLRICRALESDPNTLLGWSERKSIGKAEQLRLWIAVDLAMLGVKALGAVQVMTTALAAVAERRPRK